MFAGVSAGWLNRCVGRRRCGVGCQSRSWPALLHCSVAGLQCSRQSSSATPQPPSDPEFEGFAADKECPNRGLLIGDSFSRRRQEAEDMCIDSTSEATVTRVLAYSARTVTPRLYGNLSGFHSVTAASSWHNECDIDAAKARVMAAGKARVMVISSTHLCSIPVHDRQIRLF